VLTYSLVNAPRRVCAGVAAKPRRTQSEATPRIEIRETWLPNAEPY